MSMCASAGTRLKGLTAISLLTVIGLILVLAATGCGDAEPIAPDDLPVATSTPAGPVEPVNTASSGDDPPVAASTPAGSVKPVNTALTGDGTWVLHMVDGRPVIEGSVVTMRISASDLEGFDGCNKYFGGWYEDETPVAGPDGVFSLPSFARTEIGCTGVRGKMEQAEAYFSALIRGERFRVADDRLEILDGEGAIMLVFDRVAPLPGRPVDLRGTSWRLISADDVDNDLRVTTMIFNGRQVTGSTACGDYYASYEMSEGRVRFPSHGRSGSRDTCTELARRRRGEFSNFFTWAWEYSVHEEQGISRLRIRSSRGKTLTFEPLP